MYKRNTGPSPRNRYLRFTDDNTHEMYSRKHSPSFVGVIYCGQPGTAFILTLGAMAARQMRQLITIGLLILISCGTPTGTVDNSFYSDKRLSFYDPSDENFSLKVWIRKSENIRILHETFKKYGYSKI